MRSYLGRIFILKIYNGYSDTENRFNVNKTKEGDAINEGKGNFSSSC